MRALAVFIMTCLLLLSAAVHAQTVTVMMARDVSAEVQDVFVAAPGEPNVDLVFAARERVTGFRVLGIFLESVSEDGRARFTAKTLHTLPALEPQRPLRVIMQFLGSIPNNGIAYEDADGVTRTFSVEESGMDGSLQLTPITVVP